MEKIIEKLKNKQKISAREVRELIRNRKKLPRELFAVLAKRVLEMGENFYAYDLAENIPDHPPENLLQKIHIMALALARSGSLERASELLEQLPDSDDTEIVGLKSRILKDMAANTTGQEARRQLFKQSARLSLAVFEQKNQYYNGINAASCLFMAGENAAAGKLVREKILPLCRKFDHPGLWEEATLGECFLLLNECETAAEHYGKAADIAVNNGLAGSLASTLKQFYMLAAGFPEDRIRQIVQQMHLPAIGIFSGHMIDRPARPEPRFPACAEAQVRRDLAGIISKRNIRIAFSSCACGGDIIFMEEVLKAGGECFIVPPLPMKDTIANSVDIIPGADWKERLFKILENKNVSLFEPESDEIGVDDDDIIYDFTNRYILGLAVSRSEMLHFPLRGVTVWDGKKSGLTGGTDSAVALWQQKNIPLDTVTPEIEK
ncbi:MAG: hypothetical protein IKC94_04840 [Lentisphaeria bacterium]|nr:hypothetical protein [Lentisphaeria bacterium]